MAGGGLRSRVVRLRTRQTLERVPLILRQHAIQLLHTTLINNLQLLQEQVEQLAAGGARDADVEFLSAHADRQESQDANELLE